MLTDHSAEPSWFRWMVLLPRQPALASPSASWSALPSSSGIKSLDATLRFARDWHMEHATDGSGDFLDDECLLCRIRAPSVYSLFPLLVFMYNITQSNPKTHKLVEIKTQVCLIYLSSHAMQCPWLHKWVTKPARSIRPMPETPPHALSCYNWLQWHCPRQSGKLYCHQTDHYCCCLRSSSGRSFSVRLWRLSQYMWDRRVSRRRMAEDLLAITFLNESVCTYSIGANICRPSLYSHSFQGTRYWALDHIAISIANHARCDSELDALGVLSSTCLIDYSEHIPILIVRCTIASDDAPGAIDGARSVIRYLW